jgi:hypothetical protein
MPLTEITDERAQTILDTAVHPALHNLAETGISEIRTATPRRSRKNASPDTPSI